MGDPLGIAKRHIICAELAKWEHRISIDARDGRDDWTTLWPLVAGGIVDELHQAEAVLDAAYAAGWRAAMNQEHPPMAAPTEETPQP